MEGKDRQLSGFLEVLVSYHGISKLTIAKMAGVEENDIDRLLANPPEKIEIEVKYKIAQFGGYFYGKKKRQPTKSSNERNLKSV